MVTRRNLIKTLSLLSGAAILSGLPMAKAAAKNANSLPVGKKTRLVIVGTATMSAHYLQFALQHPGQIEVVAIVSAKRKHQGALARQLHVSPDACFGQLEQFLQSGIQADTIWLLGQKEVFKTTQQAVKAGYNVWSDRPIAHTPLDCKKLNKLAAASFCKIQIAFVVNNELCLMENKTHEVKV